MSSVSVSVCFLIIWALWRSACFSFRGFLLFVLHIVLFFLRMIFQFLPRPSSCLLTPFLQQLLGQTEHDLPFHSYPAIWLGPSCQYFVQFNSSFFLRLLEDVSCI
ncbi:hypothetical protein BDV06DRAFT_22526 [Aspergillus oleicola]